MESLKLLLRQSGQVLRVLFLELPHHGLQSVERHSHGAKGGKAANGEKAGTSVGLLQLRYHVNMDNGPFQRRT